MLSAGVRRRWVYTYAHRARTVEFGPYEDDDEARTAFQRLFGYWPDDPTETQLWTPERVA